MEFIWVLLPTLCFYGKHTQSWHLFDCILQVLGVKYHYQFVSLKPMPFFSQKTCPSSSTCSFFKLEAEKGASVLPGVERYYRRHCRNRFQKIYKNLPGQYYRSPPGTTGRAGFEINLPGRAGWWLIPQLARTPPNRRPLLSLLRPATLGPPESAIPGQICSVGVFPTSISSNGLRYFSLSCPLWFLILNPRCSREKYLVAPFCSVKTWEDDH